MSILDSQATRTAVRYLRKSGGLIKTLKIFGVVFGAAMIAASPWIGAQTFQNANAVETGMLVAGLAFSVFGGIALVFVDQTTPELIEENLNVLGENEELNNLLDFAEDYQDHLLARITVHSQVRELVEQAIVEGCSSVDDASRFARSILSIFVERKLSLFGIGDEYWNFGVYLYDATKEKLVCIACRRERSEHEELTHREWERGVGHVGLAFSRSSEIIFADSNTPELRPLLTAKDQNFREYDEKRYVSVASIPISTDGTNPLGVLIATSDVQGRFKSDQERTSDDWENTDALREVAASLAIILQMIHAADKAGGTSDDFDDQGVIGAPS